MILNANTASHDMYLPDRRSRSGKAKPAARPARNPDAPDPNGTLEQKCAWMRQRQAKPKGRKRAVGASVRGPRERISCGVEDVGDLSARDYEALLIRQAEDAAGRCGEYDDV